MPKTRNQIKRCRTVIARRVLLGLSAIAVVVLCIVLT